MNERRITHRAADRREGMTLAELAEFLADCTAAGLETKSAVRVVVGFRSQVQQITAASEPHDDIEVIHHRWEGPQ